MHRGSKVTPENQGTSTECVSNQTVLMRTRGRGRGRGGRGRGRKVSPSPADEVSNTSDTNEQTQNINSYQQNSEAEQPANAGNKKRKRSKPLEIPQEKQDEVADWYRENELLYNKDTSHYQYKDTVLKNTRWQAKANELGVKDWKSLRTWIDSMRSQLGRLTREGNKSGSGRKEDTPRDKQIKEKFAFLGPHIARLKEKLKAKYGTDACVDSPSDHEDEEEGQEDDDSRSQCSLDETSSTMDIPPPIGTKKEKEIPEGAIAS